MAHHQPIRKQPAGSRTDAPKPPTDIPDKLYFRIGEVARLCDVPAYVLRFWEGEFPQLKPNKGGTGQRLFRRRDVEMALRIKRLLYDEGYTIPGARQLLKSEAKQKEPQLTLLADDTSRAKDRELQLRTLRQELQSLLADLQTAPRSAPLGPMAALPFGARVRPAARRAPSAPLPTSENLFDFPGTQPGASASAGTPRSQKDPS